MDKDKILRSIERDRKGALKDCWRYHKHIIKDEGNFNPKEDDLEHYLFNLDLTDWEDVAFFVGYLRGLDRADSIVRRAKTK